MRVKICGLTRPEDAVACRRLGADFLGMIFAESPRRLSLEQAREIVTALPDFKGFVGVFCDEPASAVERVARELGISILQFHGNESPVTCDAFRRRGFRVIKAFGIVSRESLALMDAYDLQDILLDCGRGARTGGTGTPFDWSVLKGWNARGRNVFISGGLAPENVGGLLDLYAPYAVDASSRLEERPGEKNLELVKLFIERANSTSRAGRPS